MSRVVAVLPKNLFGSFHYTTNRYTTNMIVFLYSDYSVSCKNSQNEMCLRHTCKVGLYWRVILFQIQKKQSKTKQNKNKNKQTNKQTNKQANKQTNKQTKQNKKQKQKQNKTNTKRNKQTQNRKNPEKQKKINKKSKQKIIKEKLKKKQLNEHSYYVPNNSNKRRTTISIFHAFKFNIFISIENYTKWFLVLFQLLFNVKSRRLWECLYKFMFFQSSQNLNVWEIKCHNKKKRI